MKVAHTVCSIKFWLTSLTSFTTIIIKSNTYDITIIAKNPSDNKPILIQLLKNPLLPLTGEKLPKGSITSPGARLDVSARNLWSPLAKAFIDVRVFNPQAKANWEKSIPQMYKSHEEEKKQGYLPRVLQVEKGTFTPAVFSTSGGMGKEADRLLRRMAERISIKRGENYSSVVSFLRRRFRFDLLKTCVIAMRGYKKPTTTAAKIDTLDLDLRTTASSC